MCLIQKAIERAKEAHKGQKRRNGEDYFEAHVRPVAEYVDKNSFKLVPHYYRRWLDPDLYEEVIAAAYLHDVLEDTKYTIDDFPLSVIDMVKSVSKIQGENYFDFIKRVASGPFGGVIIKKADLINNLSTLDEGSMKDKYRFALNYLERVC